MSSFEGNQEDPNLEIFPSCLVKAAAGFGRADRRSFFRLASGGLGLLSGLAAVTRPPQVDAAMQSEAGGALEGIVRAADTGAPIAGARVMIGPAALTLYLPAVNFGSPPSANLLTTVTDSLGRFSFADVTPRAYRLYAAADGYAPHEFGQSPKGVTGIPLDVLSGGTIRELSVHLNPAVTITGRILDPDRQPLPSIPVYLVSQFYDGIGRQSFRLIGRTDTDERGEYRLFGIEHGDYYVLAGIEQPFGAEFNAVLGRPTSPYALTYYPGFMEIDLATRIRVEAGVQVSGIDFSLKERVLRRIRGQILNDGRPVESARLVITALWRGTENEMTRTSTEVYNAADGTFEYLDLEPRRYLIYATSVEETAGRLQSGEGLSVRATVDLERSDAETLIFRLPVEFGTISGRIRTEDFASVVWGSLNIVLRPQDGGPTRILFPNADGILEANLQTGVPRVAEANVAAGYYRVSVTGNLGVWAGSGAYLKDVLMNGQSILYQTFFIAPNYQGQLDVVVGRNGARVQGAVRDESGRPLEVGSLVALIPRPREGRMEQYRSVLSGQAGRFEFEGVGPGSYSVMAWEEAERASYFDPIYLEAAEPGSPQITVREGDSVSIDVRVTRLDR